MSSTVKAPFFLLFYKAGHIWHANTRNSTMHRFVLYGKGNTSNMFKSYKNKQTKTKNKQTNKQKQKQSKNKNKNKTKTQNKKQKTKQNKTKQNKKKKKHLTLV